MLLKFGLISGLGWLLDFSIFVALGAAGFLPGVANGIAATVAVTFVYFSSLRPIFKYEGHYMMRKLMAYWLYQLVAVTLASLTVNFLATAGMHSIVAKIVVTPFTFLANYLFMKWLAEVGRPGV